VFPPTLLSKFKTETQTSSNLLLNFSNLNQNYNLEPFDESVWSQKSIQEISSKIDEQTKLKEKLINENNKREQHIQQLEKEIQLQKTTSRNVNDLITNYETRLNFLETLKSNQKRSLDEMNFENMDPKKFKTNEIQFEQVEWSNPTATPIDVSTIVNALDEKEESAFDLFLNE
jgi:predicted  nucleic acid-binding Zn-ribbon protein